MLETNEGNTCVASVGMKSRVLILLLCKLLSTVGALTDAFTRGTHTLATTLLGTQDLTAVSTTAKWFTKAFHLNGFRARDLGACALSRTIIRTTLMGTSLTSVFVVAVADTVDAITVS